MRPLLEGWIAAKNLLLFSVVFCRRESRNIWKANFNSKEYLVLNPDVARSGYPPVLHYLFNGNRDPRNPSPRFQTRLYLERHPEAGRAGINALVHFAAFGKGDGDHAAWARNGPVESPPLRTANIRWPETEPLVSVVILCSGGGEFLERALESIIHQTFAGIEIIVVEGGSAELEASGKSGVRFLRRDRQYAAADDPVADDRNFGIAAARGRYVLCMNTGERPHPIYVDPVSIDPLYIEGAVFQAEAFGHSTLMERGKDQGAAIISGEPFLNLGPPADQARGVLFALPFLSFGGGVELLTRRVAGWAKEAGWTPLVTTTVDLPPGVPRDPSCLASVTPRVYPLETLFPSDAERLTFVRYLIQRYRVQLLVLGGSEAMYRWLPAIKAAYPALTVADHLFNGVGHANSNHQFRDYIDATVVQSEGVMQEIQRRLGDPAGAAWRIPLGVEIPETVRVSSGDIVIGYFGRLSHEKGPDLFIEIATRLVKHSAKQHDPNLPPSKLRFVIAGDGPEKDAVKKLIRSSHLESLVEMPGFVEPIRPLMSQTDIVVLPSRIDGMPSAVLEAQALGIPVVASRVGGVPELIDDGETGYLCPIGSIDLFCDRIEELIRNPELRKQIGARARRFVQQNHGMEQMKLRYLQLLEELGQRNETRGEADNEELLRRSIEDR